MKHPLKETIDRITFENRSKYKIELDFLNFSCDHFYLHVNRKAMCNIRKIPITISNDSVIARDITSDQLIKTVFEKIGQFEAHEFCESFQYNGVAAYFPHDTSMDKGLPYLYGKSNRINDLLLKPWNDISQDRTDFDIAKRHAKLWWKQTPLVRGIQFAKGWIRVKQYRIKSRISNLYWRTRRAIAALFAKDEPKNAYDNITISFTLNMETGAVTHHDKSNKKAA